MTRCKAELITPGAGLYQEVDELEDESVTYLRAMILKEWGRDLKKGKFAVIWKSNSDLAGSSDPSEVFYEAETGKFIQKTQTYRTARIYEIRRDGSLKYLEQRRLRIWSDSISDRGQTAPRFAVHPRSTRRGPARS